MDNTYNYLKNVFQKAKEEITNNPFIALVSLVLITIPLHYRYSNIAVILLVVYSLFSVFKSQKTTFNKDHFWLVLIYFLMLISVFWTIDFDATRQALSKELSFILIPLCFFLNPPISTSEKNKIIQYYSYSFLFFTIFCLFKSGIRYLITKDVNVFFYHELVTFDVNAIHVSVYVSIAFFYFFLKKEKSVLDIISIVLFLLFLVLLSSKNIIITFFLLLIDAVVKTLKAHLNLKKIVLIVTMLVLISVTFSGNLISRFKAEIDTNITERTINKEISNETGLVYNVSINEAWNKETFQANDYFPGTALRVYLIRVFKEMLFEDSIFIKGYGLNALKDKMIEKRKEHNLYPGYDKFNFHNQYIQFFAELGIFGFLILTIILIKNLKNAINKKDFIHFSFAVLMISLFLTESFLSRQRGIVFFVMMYCVFNARITSVNSKN